MGAGLMRREDWVERLDVVLRDAATRVFVWGQWDCCLFVGACIEAMTGEHPVPDAIGAYHDEASARDWLRDHFGSIEAMARLFLGAPIEPVFAGRGSVALIAQNGHHAFGLVGLDGKTLLFVDEKGLRRVPKSFGSVFWTVR